MSERELQTQIVRALRMAGAKVFVISEVGIDGLPDLAVRPHWLKGKGLWLLVEVKTPAGKLRSSQQFLYDAGGSVMVRSVDDAIKLLEAYPCK